MSEFLLLKNHKDKCRVCFRVLDKSIRCEELNESHQTLFKSLTELELKKSSRYSDRICIMCIFELRKCVKFRATAAERQQNLYELFPLTDSDNEELMNDDDKSKAKLSNKKHKKPTQKQSNNHKSQVICIDLQSESDTELENKSSIIVIEETTNVVPESVFIDARSKEADGIEFKIEDGHQEECLVNIIPPTKELVKSEPFSMKITAVHSLCNVKKRVTAMSLKLRRLKKIKLHLKTFECDLCDFQCTSDTKSQIRKHMSTRHLFYLRKANKRKYQCDFCGLERYNRELMTEHLKRELQKKYKEYDCETCEKVYRTRKAMNTHKKRCGQGSFFCDFCMRPYITKSNLKEHITKQHMDIEPMFLCHLCSRTFVTCKSLSMHLFQHKLKKNRVGTSKRTEPKFESKVNAEGEFLCNCCDAKYTKKVLLKAHDRAHHQGLRYFCVYPDCNKEYCFKKDIKGHLIRTHGVIDEIQMNYYKRLLLEQQAHTIDLEGGTSWKKRNKRGTECQESI